MTTRFQSFWQTLRRRDEPELPSVPLPAVERPRQAAPALEIAPNDPIIAYFLSTPGVAEIERLQLDSPALRAMRAGGIKLAVPLISQGELIGVLNLGPRLSEQDYSIDDRGLLGNLATQAAPALRVAQLVRQQRLEAQERERIAQELRVARLIQQTLLPKTIPALQGWQLAAYYQPAREVGGDFYDFLELPEGQLGLVIGDVTDKGVPAALVMATTRSLLRAAAERMTTPGKVLERVNDLLYDDIPPNMFVTCLYAILDPASGRLQYANAGHDLPYRRGDGGVDELRATGMPLGLMPGMHYDEKEALLAPGESVLFYSDGLVEAHNPQREMLGFPQLKELVAGQPDGGDALIHSLLDALSAFTGAAWEQEDDITLVTLQREAARAVSLNAPTREGAEEDATPPGWRQIASLNLPSEAGNERLAMEQVADVVRDLGLPPRRLERLKTAVAEATMNAIEHGNHYQAELPVAIDVLASPQALAVRITDRGEAMRIGDPAAPDLYAKLDGAQSPRGWGLFLIKNMVDEMTISGDAHHHTVELIVRLEGDADASKAS